jgi:hypothetical protein
LVQVLTISALTEWEKKGKCKTSLIVASIVQIDKSQVVKHSKCFKREKDFNLIQHAPRFIN